MAGAHSARAVGRLVYVNEVPTFRFSEQVGDIDGSDRAQQVARNLALYDEKSVKVVRHGRAAAITLGDHTILTISAAEARGYGVTALSLVNTWARTLRGALALPPLRLSATSLRLAPASEKSFTVIGSQVEGAQAISSNPSILSASKENGVISVRAVKPGLAKVTIKSAKAEVSVRVRVLPYAVDFPQKVTASVTGAPATPETVRGAIRSALLTELQKQPGTRLAYRTGAVTSVPTGEGRTFTISVRATAPDAVQSEGVVTVTVQNSALTNTPDGELWFCNKPESVLGPGDLFSASLKPDRPVRMLYHHFNASGSDLFLRVTAVNNTDKPAELWLIPGDSEPTKNPALAGLRAADQFARNWVCNSGEIVRIPPRTTLPIALRKLYVGQTMSGLCSLRLLSGGPDTLRIMASATAPFSMDDSWRAALQSSTPWREVGSQPIQGKFLDELRPSEHIYGRPFLDKEFLYTVGQANSIIRLGSEEIVRHGTGEKLGGNYGVMYNLRTSIENPTKVAAEVELRFRASGGYSGGLFLIDGNVIRTPLLNPDQEVCVTTFRVEPGLRRFLMIQTLPLSGCSYPATITLRLRDPITTTSALASTKK